MGSDGKKNDDESSILTLMEEGESADSDGHTDAREDSLVDETVGRYKVTKRVARGGTAVIYKARDTVLQRDVALKVLLEHLANKQQFADRFQNEARLIAQIQHPNIVSVYDVVQFEDRTILVVEFVPGITLEQLLKNKAKISEDHVIMICLEILNGLKAAHQRGIIHRDIKPSNILIHPELGVKISDFGIAKGLESSENANLTKAGMYLGTPTFSSPEQIEGHPIDQRSDIFSLGLTAYMLATGSHAFKNAGDSTTTVWFKIVRGMFVPLRNRNPDLSPEFESIISKSLEVDVEKRFQDADAFMGALLGIMAGRGLIPYQAYLREFLKDPTRAPYQSRAAATKKKAKSRRLLPFVVTAIVLLGVATFFLTMDGKKDTQREPQVESQREAIVEKTVPKKLESVATPIPEVELSRPAEVSPTKIASEKKAEIKKNESKVSSSSKTAHLRNSKIPTPVGGDVKTEVKPVQNSGLAAVAPSLLTSAPIFVQGAQVKIISFVRGEAPLVRWKDESKRGNSEVLAIDTYRSKVHPPKRPLIISSQFADAEVELNPYLQTLKLNWSSGPDASAYRVEISSDPHFSQLLFSGTVGQKNISVERQWSNEQELYWRISYLDESRNPFLMDASRKLKLVIKATPTVYDFSIPNSAISANEGAFNVRVQSPPKGSMACYFVLNDGAEQARRNLQAEGVFLTGKFEVPASSRWFVCETTDSTNARLYFTFPIK